MTDDTIEQDENLPYRRCVGAMVFNTRGEVFVGKRINTKGRDHLWQMPQGGIDKGEEPLDAALRELEEETAICSVDLINENTAWLSYDLPVDARGRWSGRYRGQTQKWFVFRFTGDETEINLTAHDSVEFCQWKWVVLRDIVDLVVPFKRPVYKALVDQFSYLSQDIFPGA